MQTAVSYTHLDVYKRQGARRLQDAYTRYGDLLIDCMHELQNYAERRLRAGIRNLKDGEYLSLIHI